MSRPLALLVGECLVAILAIGYLNLHTDEVPVVLFGVILAAFGLGLARPRMARRWALLAGLAVPGSAALALLLQFPVPYVNDLGNVVTSFVAIVPGLLGAYLGAGVRNGVAVT